MRLKEILMFIGPRINLEISRGKENYVTKTDIPETHMNYEIKTIKASNNSLVIELGKFKNINFGRTRIQFWKRGLGVNWF